MEASLSFSKKKKKGNNGSFGAAWCSLRAIAKLYYRTDVHLHNNFSLHCSGACPPFSFPLILPCSKLNSGDEEKQWILTFNPNACVCAICDWQFFCPRKTFMINKSLWLYIVIMHLEYNIIVNEEQEITAGERTQIAYIDIVPHQQVGNLFIASFFNVSSIRTVTAQ